MLNIIQYNPFRLIGVFSTATRKEIMANLARIKANLRVNRPIYLHADLNAIFTSTDRNAETMAIAESKLSLSKDLIRYAQFWFIESTALDKIAINNLSVGLYDKAVSIWEKKETLSSVHNRIVSFLILGHYAKALALASYFYDKYALDFAQLILGSESNLVTSKDLEHNFLDILCDEIGASEVFNLVQNKDWREYVGDKIVNPLIDDIEHSIRTANETKGKGSFNRLSAGSRLMSDTYRPLQSLKNTISIDDPRYQILADKLGLAILECGIDYYNGSDDDEAAFKTMKLHKYAQSVVIGKIAKDRCDENIRTLKDIIRKLPPQEVIANHKAIQSFIATFAIQPPKISYSIQLMKNCAPHIVVIKEKVGKTNAYYLKISTSIINNALENVITEVNEAQSKDFTTLKNTLISAWHAQLYMDQFDLELEYKDGRYKKCKKSLYEIILDCKGFDDVADSSLYKYGCGWCNNLNCYDLDLRTDEEFYLSCQSLTDYKSYLRRFASGKYTTEAKGKIEELSFKQCRTIAEYLKFINDFPNSMFVAKAEEQLSKLRKIAAERKLRTERQQKAIDACSTILDITALYIKEKGNGINIDKCSQRAFELSKSEEDYRKVISFFGVKTLGGKKAQTCLDEIKKKRKAVAKRRNSIIKWSLFLIILGLVFLGSYLSWGNSGLSATCFVVTFLSGPIALFSFATRRTKGYIIGIIAVLSAFAFASLGVYLEGPTKIKDFDYTENVEAETNDSTNDYIENENQSDSAVVEPNYEPYTVDEDYDTYINNRLKTGDKPYKKYYRSHTGSNYLDFNTSGDDYVIIVKDFQTEKVVNHVYVRADDTGRLYLPNGTYMIFFYCGKGWNPNMPQKDNIKGGFVSEEYTQKDGPIDLYNQHGRYTLYPVTNGNLQLKDASKNEAF